MGTFEAIQEKIHHADLIKPVGRVTDLVGMVIEVSGLAAPVGSLCHIQTSRNEAPLPCEVVGFRNQSLLVMPYLDRRGVAPGCAVELVTGQITIPVGDGLLGRVLDGMGRPLDGGPPVADFPRRPLGCAAPPAMSRRRDQEVLTTGIRSVDSMVTTARGQRLGIFSGSGVGKSVMLGSLSRQTSADVNVLALIGERGREVREFIEQDLGPEGLARSVVIVVTSDESAVMRAKGAETAMTIAEDFRDRDRNVLFLMDSATRYAMALREIGLAAGEPPTTKGYPPSVFAALPRLCERAGWSDVNAITAFFTVLIEGDDIQDPVGDALRSILDGHIMLSRDLARRGHYPAVDVLGSVSRLRQGLMSSSDSFAASRFTTWLKALEDNRDLVSIGAYAPGSDPILDEALSLSDEIEAFLKQGPQDHTPFDETLNRLRALTGEG